MKRYLAFCGTNYYPSAAMGDFVNDFDDLDKAIERLIVKMSESNHCDWYIVWDSETRSDVWWHNN